MAETHSLHNAHSRQCLTMGRETYQRSVVWNFPCHSKGQESACDAGDQGSIPGLGSSFGERNGNPSQYSCLENSMDREVWWATVCGGCKESDTTEQLTHTHTHTHTKPQRANRHFLTSSLLLAFTVKPNLQCHPRRTCPSNPTTFAASPPQDGCPNYPSLIGNGACIHQSRTARVSKDTVLNGCRNNSCSYTPEFSVEGTDENAHCPASLWNGDDCFLSCCCCCCC